jgi:NAD(P)H-flavin reductase
MKPPGRHRLRLLRARMLSPSVRSLTFDAGESPFAYRSGQWMNLYVPTPRGLVMRRPYSVASAPNHAGPNQLDFAVTRVPEGPTSNALHDLGEGAVVEADAAGGGWLGRRDDERALPALYVATGSGLAPFRGLLQEELAQPNGAPVGLLFGCRTQADILWRDELERWDKDVPRFSLTVTLSRPDGDWRGATGYVQTHVASLVARLRPGVVLLCGLSPMTHAVEQTLLAEGVDGARIRTEAYDA